MLLIGLYPRAMTPVTHGSALQAPERMWSIIRGRETSGGLGFILVYRLAIDARTLWGDDGTARKWPSLLGDFQTGIASMARKRHHASTARGLLCFCLMASQDRYPFHPSNPW